MNGAEVAVEEVEVTSYDKDWYVQYFEFGDTIDDKLIWSANKEIIADSYYRKPDAWYVDGDYFLGIRLKNDDGYQYGWVRFNSKYLYMKFSRDAAVQLVSGAPIKAGEGITSIAPVAGPVTIENNNNAWSDIQIWFYPSWFDAHVQEYRVLVVKASKAAEITIERLLEASTANCHNVGPGDYSYKFLLNDSLLDLDNEGIKLGESYRICLLSVSNNTDSFPHAFTLTQSFIFNTELPSVNAPAVFDVADNENSTDIQVVFSKSEKEEFVKEYRIMILPHDSAAVFYLGKAAEVAEGNFYVIPPGGDSVYTIQNIEMTDIYGNPIEQKQKYNAFIWSVPDQENANIASLSEPSNVFVLNVPNYFYAGQTDGAGVEYFALHEQPKESIDIDYDDKPEIEIVRRTSETKYGFNYHVEIYSGENTAIIYLGDSTPKNLFYGEPINNQYTYSSDPLVLASNYGDCILCKTEFQYFNDGIVGFRMISEQDTIFGWARIRTGRIKDYARQKRVTQSVIEIPDSGENLFVTYPNPNSDRILNIALKEFVAGEDYQIEVFNASGIKMKRILVTEPLFQINLNGMPGGLYYVQLTTPEKQETQKLVVQ
ncbi:MAG: T9SS type A sorting domain-containing protein [Mariniphaga sp.]|nr:T9SS type A sorting domain-containing protein [Mariniphaga sp.]